jgi:hypothetical protein
VKSGSPQSSAFVRRVGALIIFCALAGCGDDAPIAPGPEANADLSLSPARAKVGEPVEITMTVVHPAGTDVRFPPADAIVGVDDVASDDAPSSATGGGLEIVKAGRARTHELEAGWSVTERMVTVRGFRTGGYSLGPHEVRLVSMGDAGDTDPRALVTPAAKLEVYSVLSEDSTLADLRGEAGPFEIEPEPTRWGWAIFIGLTVISHVFILGFALRRILRRREEIRLHPPLPPPHEAALAELARIRESGLLDDGKTAEYTDRVSDVLRLYLEERFAIPAPERTTEEFLDEVARAPVLDRERKRFLADYLTQCDLVKFAAAEPGRRELDEMFGSSVRFVEETAGARAVTAEA